MKIGIEQEVEIREDWDELKDGKGRGNDEESFAFWLRKG